MNERNRHEENRRVLRQRDVKRTVRRKYANVEGYEAKVYEFALAQATEVVNLKPDCVLVSPQVRYQLDKISEQMPCPVAVIDMMAFGRMDGVKALAQAKELMGE